MFENNERSYLLFFRAADSVDITAIVLGTLGAIVSGLTVPYFNYIFGTLINSANSDNFSHKIPKLCETLLVLTAIAVVAGIVQVKPLLFLLCPLD